VLAGDANYFGSYDDRSAVFVAREIDAVVMLPEGAFDAIAPDLLDVASHARSPSLRFHARDAYYSRASAQRAAELAARLRLCFDQVVADDAPGRLNRQAPNVSFISSFVSCDLNHISAATRTCPEIRAFLTDLSKTKSMRMADYVYRFTVEMLIASYESDEDRRAALKDVVITNGRGAPSAARLLKPLLTAECRQALRVAAAQGELNRTLIRLLADVGDEQALPIIQQRLIDAEEVGEPARIQFLREQERKIAAQHPPSGLLSMISDPQEDLLRYWAIHRALDLGVDAVQVREAFGTWADWAKDNIPLAKSLYVRKLVDDGILVEYDPEDIALASAVGVGHSEVQRRVGLHAMPDRDVAQTVWRPSVANVEAFAEWFGSVDWPGISEEQSVFMIKQKCCELNLLSPDTCEALTTSAPAVP
jgi:hypothetical protein